MYISILVSHIHRNHMPGCRLGDSGIVIGSYESDKVSITAWENTRNENPGLPFSLVSILICYGIYHLSNSGREITGSTGEVRKGESWCLRNICLSVT
ncbi:hypothetical protein QQG55_20890 [Brugia pahangi]